MASPAPTWPEPTRWALERLARGGGTVLLLGGVDTGKSTLAAELVNRGLAAGRRVAVVDADVGQSDVGPPATIGLGFPGAPAGSLAEIAAERLYFVGDTSPAGHLLPAVVGTSRLAHVARARGCDLIVVDTTGMVSGRLAEALKFHKIQAVRPRALVAVQAAAEVEPLLAPFDAPGGPR
ncbi:MAG: polyhydroxyalkanoate depolymerase, partial [Armatimonadetes bacterium]|nr:polyhydroxyalkanoate depolymerase [Armatimonadota bacterium]